VTTHDVAPAAFADLAGALAEPDAVIEEMDDKADREGFPTVGPAVGAWLRLLARATDAERVFEFGSGFGYSAYWFAAGLPPDGEIVLTEVDADELAEAREFLARGGFDDRARFELGDAIETIDRYEGPFDLALIDNEKRRYVEAYEAIRGKLAPGAVVCADNVLDGPIEFETVRALTRGASPAATDAERGIAGYLDRVREDPGVETTLLPLGEGVAVSVVRG